jgi:hypothetical protein
LFVEIRDFFFGVVNIIMLAIKSFHERLVIRH